MALELNKLTHEVEALSVNAVQRLHTLADVLPTAQAMLQAIGVAGDELHRKIETAKNFRWAGGIPTAEAVHQAYLLPTLPARLNVIAADGSQIYPDRHGVALYYLINVGSIVFRHGLAQPPSTHSAPQVFFEDTDLYETDGGQIPSIKIDAERDLRELGELARLAQIEAATGPTVALLDNGLLLYISLQSTNERFVDEVIEQYLDRLDLIKASGGAVAGVVDRPRAASVIRLLRLALLNANEIAEATLRDLGDFRHLSDATLFEFLQPGERSALFENASPANQDRYRPRGHSIYFFYLNVGRAGRPSILRVEVPEWVALHSSLLDLVHAALHEQSRVTDGFPYVLVRAHELAVVTQTERREFDQMVAGGLIRQGLSPSISHKAQGKAWTGAAKRRYP